MAQAGGRARQRDDHVVRAAWFPRPTRRRRLAGPHPLCGGCYRCGLPGFQGLLVVADWQQHLEDYKSGFFLGGEYQDALVKSTLSHWTSLFALSKFIATSEGGAATNYMYSKFTDPVATYTMVQDATVALAEVAAMSSALMNFPDLPDEFSLCANDISFDICS